MIPWLWLLLLTPLVAAMVRRGAVLAVFLSFFAALRLLWALLELPAGARSVVWQGFTWIHLPSLHVSFGLLLDPLSLTWCLVITGVGALIHWYSLGAMRQDPERTRFFVTLNFFVFAMLLLVLADNFAFLLIGWAGVGLASYLLIGFWHDRPAALAAARKAFIINIIGDAGIMAALYFLWASYDTLDYGPILGQVHLLRGHPSATAIALLLLVGVLAKSAQFPLHTWLPDAMEGPTPVSALIHAATMVTAGVYLLARAYPLFAAAPEVLTLAAWLGGLSALMAAWMALGQRELKRVLAYSTMSQVGYMVMAVASGAIAAGVFHFVTHAFFKALLFLAAGAVMHALAEERDIYQMGGLRLRLPVVERVFLVGALALSGAPLFSGFFSKDAVLGGLLGAHAWGLYLIGLVTAGLTALYMFRLYFLVFDGHYRGRQPLHPDLPVTMRWPLMILAVLAVLGGWLNVPGGYDLVGAWLAASAPEVSGLTAAASASVTLALAVAGFLIARTLYTRLPRGRKPSDRALATWLPFYGAAQREFGLDALAANLLVRPLGGLANWLWEVPERRWLLRLAEAVGETAEELGVVVSTLQSGYVRRYALAVFGGTTLFLLYFALTAYFQ